MAKTFTQKEPIFSSITESDDYSSGSDDDQQVAEMIDQLKNLRFRPSLSSTQLIMQYARVSMGIAAQ
jgi:hypothetical protein